jgi:hypothetical protein
MHAPGQSWPSCVHPVNYYYYYALYTPRHENCPLFAFDIIEKSDTFCDGEHTVFRPSHNVQGNSNHF